MRIAVACGGTGGHTFPGLATAAVLRDRGHEVEVLAAGRSIEASTLKGWDGPLFKTGARRLSPKFIFHNLLSVAQVFAHFVRKRPAVLLAMGSYSIMPPVVAAKLLGVPVVLHEANSVPGKANVFFSKAAKKVAISFAESARYFPSGKTVHTGMPVRKSLLGQATAPKKEGECLVFVTGGSQGAKFLNDTLPEAIAKAASKGVEGLRVVHQAGPGFADGVRAAYAALGVEAEVGEFFPNMGGLLKSADVVVARAGAATCAEVCLFGVPAVFIPLPSAVGDHQFHNAKAMDEAGAAIVARQASCTVESLADVLGGLVGNRSRLQAMRTASLKLAAPGAADQLADVVLSAV